MQNRRSKDQTVALQIAVSCIAKEWMTTRQIHARLGASLTLSHVRHAVGLMRAMYQLDRRCRPLEPGKRNGRHTWEYRTVTEGAWDE